MVALEAEKYLAEEARERQLANLRKGVEIPVKENLPQRENGQAREQAAALVGVSGKLVQDAKFIAKRIRSLLLSESAPDPPHGSPSRTRTRPTPYPKALHALSARLRVNMRRFPYALTRQK